MTLYTFLWCDISSLFIYFLLFWFLQLWLTGIVGEILELKKVFYLFSVSVLSIPTRVAFVVLEFVFATPVCYVTNFLLFTVIHKPNESQGTQLITSLRSVRSVEFNKPQRTRPFAITTYANISHCYRFFQFFVWFISFILDRKRSITLSFGQTSSPYPPARYLKTLHTDNLY